MIPFKTITVPNRDSQGWLHGSKDITVEWVCPTCSGPMGDPALKPFSEDGEFYSVHVWQNPCGHVAKYVDLKTVSAREQSYREGMRDEH